MPRLAKTLGEVASMNLLAESGGNGIGAQLKAVKKGAEAATVLACLAIAHLEGAGADGWPAQYEYAAYWKITERQASREWDLIRRAFPGEAGPDRLAKILALDYGPRLQRSGAGAALSVPYAGTLAAA
jgi:hypothetical protein